MKTIISTGILALALLWTGCGMLDAVDDDTCDLTYTEIGTINGSTSSSTTKYIEATVDANVEITAIEAVVVKKSDGTTVSSDQISLERSDLPSGEKKIEIEKDGDFEIKMIVTSQACMGDYIIKYTATAGGATTSKQDTFTVTGTKNCEGTAVATFTLNAGAQESSKGSLMDLDSDDGTVWSSADAGTHEADVDLCYGHTAANGDKVGSALWAKNSGFGTGWGSNPPDVNIMEVTMTSTQFDAVETAEEIEDLWNGDDAVHSLTVVEGDVFIVETTEGAYALVRITDQTAGSSGEITIKVAR